MKYLTYVLTVFWIIISGCNSKEQDYSDVLTTIDSDLASGDFTELKQLADSTINFCRDETLVRKADSLSRIAHRIEVDFSLKRDEVLSQLKEKDKDFRPEDMEEWERRNWLEFRIIDGEKRYFNRTVSNLGLLKGFYLNRTARDSTIASDKRIIYRRAHTSEIINASKGKTDPVLPVEMEILYTLTVKPDVVPPGETIRCWLPFPKENDQRQSEVYLLAVSNEDFILSPDTMIHRTIYMEEKAKAGEPVTFSIAFSYKSSGQYFDPSLIKPKPYNRNSELYKKYTVEKLPQICFTNEVKKLTDSIVGTEENPFETVKKIYYWFNNNIF